MATTAQDLYQIAESGDAEGLRDRLRYMALTNLYYYSKVVLGYKELSPVLHQEFCEYIIQTREQRRRGALIPRGHFKSTIVSKSYPLWRLTPIAPEMLEMFPDLEDWQFCHNLNHRVAIVGESQEVANKNLKDMKWNLLNNQMLQWLFPEIIPPDINKTIWREDEVLLPRNRSFDESSITTLGVGAKTTGKHWDIIIYDDLIGEKASKSEAEMEAAKAWFKFAPGLANDPNTVEELFIGTRWKAGTADLYGHVMATLPSEEEDVTNQDEVVDTDTGERTGGFTWYIRSAVEPNTDGVPTPIFPERFSLQTLAGIARRLGTYAYSCNYLNNPVAEGMSDFDVRWLKEYEVSEDQKTLRFFDGTPSVLLGHLSRVSFYDPASGGKSAKCEAALVAVGSDWLHRKIILEEWSDNTTYGKAACRWMRMNDRFRFHKNYYEMVGAQKSIEDIVKLLNLLQKYGKDCPHCKGKHQPLRLEEGIKAPSGPNDSNKKERIRAYLQEPLEAGRVYVRRNSHRKFRTQLSEFPHGPLVDVLDAGAYAVKLAPVPPSQEDREREKAEIEMRRHQHHPRTFTTENYGGY